MPRKLHDLTGRKFDTQLVIRRAEDRVWHDDTGSRSAVYWLVLCGACGKHREVQGTTLKRGTKCPCQRKREAPKMKAPVPQNKMTNKQIVTSIRRRLNHGIDMRRYNEIMLLVEELSARSK